MTPTRDKMFAKYQNKATQYFSKIKSLIRKVMTLQNLLTEVWLPMEITGLGKITYKLLGSAYLCQGM